MTENQHPIFELLDQDKRYKLEAYQFVRDALSFAQDVLGLGKSQPQDDPPPLESEPLVEPHLTGQQLCEAVRQYSIEQFGYMAQMVLNNWGIRATGDVGEIVYNLIRIGRMKKSEEDRREDFDDVYSFDTALNQTFRFTLPE